MSDQNRPAGMSDDDSDSDDGIYSSSLSSVGTVNSGIANRGRGRGSVDSYNKVDEFATNPRDHYQQQIQFPRGGGRGRGIVKHSQERSSSSSEHEYSRDNQIDRPWQNSYPSPNLQMRDRKQILLFKLTNNETAGSVDRDYALQASNIIQTAWKANKVDQFREKLKNIFEGCLSEGRNLFSLGLFCVINSPDFNFDETPGTQAISVFYSLKTAANSQKISAKPSAQAQEVAVEIAISIKLPLLKIFIEIFDLSNCAHVHKFIPVITSLCSTKNYKEAATFASFLKLQGHFDIHAFNIPLLLQDKYSVVADSVKDNVQAQQSLVKFFDDCYCYGQNDVAGQLQLYVKQNKIPDVKPEKLNHRPITKLIKRLVSDFKVGLNFYPNVGSRQKFGEMRFLFSRRYEKQEMTSEGFEELVTQIAEGNNHLMEEVLSHYLMYGDSAGAAKFIVANKLYTSPSCLNYSVLQLLPEPLRSKLEKSTQKVSATEENWDEDWEADTTSTCTTANVMKPLGQETVHIHSEKINIDNFGTSDENVTQIQNHAFVSQKNYYKSHLSIDDVQMICTPEECKNMCKWIIECDYDSKYILSGFDSEWKPIMSKRHGAALLQIAFEKIIFIVDIVSLKQYQSEDHWFNLSKSYFENERILKFGFDVKNDLKMLKETIPQWIELGQGWRSVVDLQKVKCIIVTEDASFFESMGETASNEAGLSDLVKRCLGKSLSKEEQMSDWEKRPLRETQILYAANDAYCLIDVFKAIKNVSENRSLNIDKIIQDYLKGVGLSENKKRKLGYLDAALEILELQNDKSDLSMMVHSDLQVPASYNTSGSIKFVVDNMLQGLGRYLRVLGFDTTILSNVQSHDACCDHAKNGRLIISKGTACNEIMRSLPEGAVIYNVKSDQIMDQLQEICQYFNIILLPSRLFAICQYCNGSEFIKVSKEKAKVLIEAVIPDKRIKLESLILDINKFKEKAPDSLILSDDKICRRVWKLLDENHLKIIEGRQVVTTKGNPAELRKLQSFTKIFDCVYVCNTCGKCYWESIKLEAKIRQLMQLQQADEIQKGISSSCSQ